MKVTCPECLPAVNLFAVPKDQTKAKGLSHGDGWLCCTGCHKMFRLACGCSYQMDSKEGDTLDHCPRHIDAHDIRTEVLAVLDRAPMDMRKSVITGILAKLHDVPVKPFLVTNVGILLGQKCLRPRQCPGTVICGADMKPRCGRCQLPGTDATVGEPCPNKPCQGTLRVDGGILNCHGCNWADVPQQPPIGTAVGQNCNRLPKFKEGLGPCPGTIMGQGPTRCFSASAYPATTPHNIAACGECEEVKIFCTDCDWKKPEKTAPEVQACGTMEGQSCGREVGPGGGSVTCLGIISFRLMEICRDFAAKTHSPMNCRACRPEGLGCVTCGHMVGRGQ